MSESNGDGVKLIKLGLKGQRRIQFDDDWPTFTVDVVQIHTRWIELVTPYCDADGKIKPMEQMNVNAEAFKFLRGTFENSVKWENEQVHKEWMDKFDQKVSAAVALHFLKCMADESDELQDFFVPKRFAGFSSPAKPDVTFSQ